MGYTDAQTLSLRPRQFAAQLSVHEDITKRMYGAKEESSNNGFVDQIPGW